MSIFESRMMTLLSYAGMVVFLFLLHAGCSTKNSGSDQQEAGVQSDHTTWAEKLGYPSGRKVIMLHADDAGMCEEATQATVHMLENDWIQSAAAMPPCPDFESMINWAKENPNECVGLHLTLTSEWKTWRWGTVHNPSEVPGLIDPEGKMWHSVRQVVEHASPEEVEKEIRAQIEKSLAMGYIPDHLDTHMGTLFGSLGFIKVFLKVAQEYGIPANAIDMSRPEVVAKFREAGYPITDEVVKAMEEYTLPKVDNFTSAPKGESYEDKVEKFKELVRSLEPGLTEIIFHPQEVTERSKSITGSWQQRIWEKEMFGDPDLQQFFKDEGIIFTNWREIMRRFKESKAA
jgi:predicted glycoside hydrolase/deacetylase ChbG (UPF0249 family)